MVPKLYMISASPPVRAVLMCCEALNIQFEAIEMDLLKREQFKPEFLEINPQHTVPVLDDNGFIVCDSHAILIYLIRKYCKNNFLYPEELKKQSLIDQRLYFDASNLFPKLFYTVRDFIYKEATTVDSEKRFGIIEAYGIVNTYLKNKKWIAGDTVTIADLSIITTVSTLNEIIPVDSKQYPNVMKWIQSCEKLPFYGPNKRGLQKFKEIDILKNIISKK